MADIRAVEVDLGLLEGGWQTGDVRQKEVKGDGRREEGRKNFEKGADIEKRSRIGKYIGTGKDIKTGEGIETEKGIGEQKQKKAEESCCFVLAARICRSDGFCPCSFLQCDSFFLPDFSDETIRGIQKLSLRISE